MIEVKITYEVFSKNGFSICSCAVVSGADEIPDFVENKSSIKIKGNFPVSKNVNLKVDGRWEKYKTGEFTLIVDTFEETIPKTIDGIIGYLSSCVSGIGERTAKKIVRKFGLQTIDVLENTPEMILSVRGISKKKLTDIVDSYQKTRAASSLISYLTPFGISLNQCMKIHEAFGSESLNTVLHNPFKLCSIDGLNFRIADKIAKSVNLNAEDPLRVREGLLYILSEASHDEGHMCLRQDILVVRAYFLLNGASRKDYNDYVKSSKNSGQIIPLKDYLESMNISETVSEKRCKSELCELVKLKKIKGENKFAYLDYNYDREKYIAKDIVTRLKLNKSVTVNEKQFTNEIDRLEKKSGIKLATLQKDAVKTALSEKISIITGGPGTGKTTVLKFILSAAYDLFGVNPDEVTLLAPTGRAASRMSESVGNGYTASTIHSKLQLASEQEDNPASDPIDSKIVVVDELSMCDSYIFYMLMKYTSYSSKIILIGDAEQLPSVAAGNVLFELLKSKAVPVVRLSAVYRQGQQSLIVTNCELIKHNSSELRYGEDFSFIPTGNQVDTANTIISIYQSALTVGGQTLDDIQVLCPFKKKGHEAGAYELNKLLQASVNPPSASKREVKRGSTVLRVGDKVMQIKNNYDISYRTKNGDIGNGVYNGDCGYITDITADYITILFDDSKYVNCDISNIDEIDLAYAISIHKSQGSQYKTVIIPMLMDYKIMLKRNLLYTAISRAKENVIIVGQSRAIAYAVHSNSISKRNTLLAEQINKYKGE